MIPDDWGDKSNGAWISPLFPALRGGDAPHSAGPSFRADLLEYLAAYGPTTQGRGLVSVKRLREMLERHDLSRAAGVRLVASVPGRHRGNQLGRWGHLKLRSLIKPLHAEELGQQRMDSQIICQYSSVGSLGPEEKWVEAEFADSLEGGRELACSINRTTVDIVRRCS